ncbi:hypothetical protein BaRGS_00003530 [Batillaria attramentaria]|uniref:Uncharacterized protein n=1 Tax=Batillaria attramentaria TaxID=370345 RepID=A0ABD0M241_9CAEN
MVTTMAFRVWHDQYLQPAHAPLPLRSGKSWVLLVQINQSFQSKLSQHKHSWPQTRNARSLFLQVSVSTSISSYLTIQMTTDQKRAVAILASVSLYFNLFLSHHTNDPVPFRLGEILDILLQ